MQNLFFLSKFARILHTNEFIVPFFGEREEDRSRTRSCALLIKHTVLFIYDSQNVPAFSEKL